MSKPAFTRAAPRHDRQVARILEALTGREMTGYQLAEHLHSSYQSVMFYVRILRQAPRKVRVCGHRHPDAGKGRAAEVYTVGKAPDEPYVSRRQKDRCNSNTRAKIILASLVFARPMQALAQHFSISDRQMAVHIRNLRQQNLVYIAFWKRSGGNPVPFYKAGNEFDAPKPAAKTRQEYYKRAPVPVPAVTGWAAALGV